MVKKYILIDEDSQLFRGNRGPEVIVLGDGQWYHPPLFKHYLKEDYNKFSLEKLAKIKTTKSIKDIQTKIHFKVSQYCGI